MLGPGRCQGCGVSPSHWSGSQIKVLGCCLVGFLEEVCSGDHLEGQERPDGCEQGLQGGAGRNQDGGSEPLLSVTPQGAWALSGLGNGNSEGPQVS